jgi:hypothetical protein
MSAMQTDLQTAAYGESYADGYADLVDREPRRRMQVYVVKDPAPGELVEVEAGSRLDVRFAGAGLVSRWEVVGRPCNLVPLVLNRASFSFVVFRTDVPVQELVLRRTGGIRAGETRVLRIVTTD